MKHTIPDSRLLPDQVAPCAGAWIETCQMSVTSSIARCRPLRGGVD